jgi:hypothetical protein
MKLDFQTLKNIYEAIGTCTGNKKDERLGRIGFISHDDGVYAVACDKFMIGTYHICDNYDNDKKGPLFSLSPEEIKTVLKSRPEDVTIDIGETHVTLTYNNNITSIEQGDAVKKLLTLENMLSIYIILDENTQKKEMSSLRFGQALKGLSFLNKKHAYEFLCLKPMNTGYIEDLVLIKDLTDSNIKYCVLPLKN